MLGPATHSNQTPRRRSCTCRKGRWGANQDESYKNERESTKRPGRQHQGLKGAAHAGPLARMGQLRSILADTSCLRFVSIDTCL